MFQLSVRIFMSSTSRPVIKRGHPAGPAAALVNAATWPMAT